MTVPATGDGTSVSTLSVEISKSGSSRSTASPSAFSHFRIVPSTIVSPSCGIWIDVIGLLPRAARGSPSGQLLDGRSMSATCGRNASSSVGENGTGMFGGERRVTGASRCSNAFSAIVAATSAPMPTNR